ncbi:hypothetical protein [Pseudonocardia sp. ICBG601]|uniref:hypothetical protein n=1 Tax=Pseudonocardia sp. ICBG601 TaxID=2846759 RepID=UPI001CF65D9B|nr:hypothetical protein [Pseudonocardia sp. ICBG601]
MRRRIVGPGPAGLPPAFWSALDDPAPGAHKRALALAAAAGVGPIAALRLAVVHRRGGPAPWDPARCPCPLHRDGP